MLVIRIIAAVLTFFFVYVFGTKLHKYCNTRFGYNFFNKKAFYMAFAADLFFVIGIVMFICAVAGGAFNIYITSAIVSASIGLAVVCFMIYINIRKTNFFCGFGGSILQLGLFLPLAKIAEPFIIIWMAYRFISFFSKKLLRKFGR